MYLITSGIIEIRFVIHTNLSKRPSKYITLFGGFSCGFYGQSNNEHLDSVYDTIINAVF